MVQPTVIQDGVGVQEMATQQTMFASMVQPTAVQGLMPTVYQSMVQPAVAQEMVQPTVIQDGVGVQETLTQQPGIQYAQPGMQFMQPNFQVQSQSTGNVEGVSVQETITQPGTQYLQPGMQYGPEGASAQETLTNLGMQYVQPGMQYMQPDVQPRPQLYT